MTAGRRTATAGLAGGLRLRLAPRESDVEAVRGLAAAAGVFSKAERKVAVELVEARLREGPESGYAFAFAELRGHTVGYCVWGPIPMTAGSFDLYWIVVHPEHRHAGVGRALLERAERDSGRRGGRHLYIETSSRPDYAPTRRFYRRAGYRIAARLTDFYAAGDDKLVFRKALEQPVGAGRLT